MTVSQQSPVATLGLSRFGRRRELKFALESYWSGKSSAGDLLTTAKALRVDTGSILPEVPFESSPVCCRGGAGGGGRGGGGGGGWGGGGVFVKPPWLGGRGPRARARVHRRR
ncbi:hypothetical protein [Mesorhizobium sp. M0114]|uniref:hypothetical protein n=1 Tax=Mesorhizobium sp. M0114 TaxID=2956882 RepID=UPI0033379A5A